MKTAFLCGMLPPLVAAIDWQQSLSDPVVVVLVGAIGILLASRFIPAGTYAAIIKWLTPNPPAPTPPPVIPPPVVDDALDSSLRAYMTLAKCPRLTKSESAQKAMGELWGCLRPGGQA